MLGAIYTFAPTIHLQRLSKTVKTLVMIIRLLIDIRKLGFSNTKLEC